MSTTTRITVRQGGTTKVEQTSAPTPTLRSPARVLSVDASFAGLNPPAFDTAAGAILHARAVTAGGGGRVLVKLYHDAQGEPLTTDTLDLSALLDEGVDVQTIQGGNATGGFAHFLLTGSLDEARMTYDIDEARIGVDVTETTEAL